MTNIYLVRHGETEWNKEYKIQGKTDIKLSEKGERQAKLLAERLVSEDINVIYTSSLSRAKKTAEIIAEKLNLSITAMDAYQEIGLGPWEGMTIDEIKGQYSEHYRTYREDPLNFMLPGAETLLEVAERAYSGIIEIVNKHKDSNIVVVSHGTAIKATIMKILDIEISKYNKFRIDNASLSIISFRDDYFGGVVVNTLNDTFYLRGENFSEL